MTNFNKPFVSQRGFARCFMAAAAWGVCLTVVVAANAAAAPAAGERWMYRVANGYNNEVRGSIQYRVEKVEAGRVAIAVATDVTVLGTARTEVYTPEGNWLRHALINHDQPVEYEFAQPYPAYVFPLDAGKSWSQRVDAINPATGKRLRVRVDGEVVGMERITVPAGAFDTIKLKRSIYAGDYDGPRSETNIIEIEWYAPSLGRAVRKDSNSGYMDQQRCTDEMSACTPVRGDWNIFELTETGAAAR
jgi:hypothetical protein